MLVHRALHRLPVSFSGNGHGLAGWTGLRAARPELQPARRALARHGVQRGSRVGPGKDGKMMVNSGE